MNITLRGRAKGLAALSVALLLPLSASASTFMASQQPTFPATETVSDNLYIAGGNVTSDGRVGGDLVAAGGTLVVDGPVGSDALIAGGNLTVLGDVGGDLRIAGGNVLVHGKVGGDVVAAGGSVLLSGARVGGDVAVAGGSVRLTAPVSGNVKLLGGDVYLDSVVSGKVEVRARKLTLGPDARILGDLTYSAQAKAAMEQGASVRGKTTYTEMPKAALPSAASLAALFSAALLIKFFMTLVGALAIALFFRRYSEEMVERAASRPLPQIGRGFVFLVVLPALALLLFVTVIGVPLGVLALFTLGAALIVANFMAAVVTGSIVWRWAKKGEYEVSWRTILLGSALYFVLGFVPFVGWLAKFILVLLALGAMADIKWHIAKDWR